jgi:hypothetical protein
MRLAYVADGVTAHATSSAKEETTYLLSQVKSPLRLKASYERGDNRYTRALGSGEGSLNFCDFTATLLQLYYYLTTTLLGRLYLCDFTDTLLTFFYKKKYALLPEDEGPCAGERRATLLLLYYYFTTTLLLLYYQRTRVHAAGASRATLLLLYYHFTTTLLLLYYQRTRVHVEESVEQWNNFVAITARPLILFFFVYFFL